MSGKLVGKVALITGAGGSIGAATARCLAAEGADVLLTDREEQPLVTLTGELGEASCAYVVADTTVSEELRAAVGSAVERFGGLDIAFVNAGVFGVVAPIVEYPEEAFDRVLAVNVKGAFLACKHALSAMRDGGSVIINSSVVGLTSEGGICAYATSKHALVGLMRTAAREVAERGIRVNTIHPGPVDNAFQHRIEVTATGVSEQQAAVLFEQNIPLGRHATPDEIAQTVMFLAGPHSAFITGATIPVDGGMSV
jgi:NAD(P)-dependent dehydrogenase (short-subunit alcohol dehydrogenase family)